MSNILNTPVSFYTGLKRKMPVAANLLDLLTGDEHEKYKDAVMTVRAEADPVKQKVLKDALPMYTISGLFFTAGSSNIYAPTSLIGIDIDEKDNTHVQNFGRLKECIQALPFVAYCGYSCRGKGYFCIVQVEAWYKHKEHFDSLVLDFKQWGVNIDKSCRDIGRRRFVSYDPEPYINPDAEVYKYVVEPQHVLSQSKGNTDRTPEEKVETTIEVARMIAVICQEQIDITGSYQSWFEICCSLANEFGEAGRDMFHAVSRYGDTYDYEAADRKFDEALHHEYNYRIATFFHYAKQAGVDVLIDFANTNN